MLEMEQKQGGVTGRSQHLDGGIVGRKVVKDLGRLSLPSVMSQRACFPGLHILGLIL